MSDWGAGQYELTAAELEPVAMRVVSMANPLRGERVLDIACGTGNAAILAARLGASVSGVDLSPRLVEVARRRADAEGLEIPFVVGDAQQLGFADGSFDVALSVFGLIFAEDRPRAFGEMIRILRPGGRAFFTVWLPGSPIDQMARVFVQAVARVTGSPANVPAFEWQESGVVERLAAGHGTSATFHDAEIQFVAPSPEEYFETNQTHHPISLAIRPTLEAAGTLETVRKRALQILRSGNEDPDGFRVTSRYRIIEIRGRGADRSVAGPAL